MKKKLTHFIQTRTGFLTLLVFCFWLKYLFAAYLDFNLGLADPYQHIIMWLSPIGTAVILISLGFYFPKPIISYIAMLVMDFANTALLFANIIYYRQFSDFLTIKTMSNAGKVSQGLGKSTVALLHPSDIFIWIDLIIIIALLIMHKIKIDQKSYGISTPFAVTSVGALILTFNIFLAETSRPRLLRNTFDRSYVVKYLGIDTFTAYDVFKSAQNVQVTKNANASDLNKILTFTKKQHAAPNPSYFGVEKKRNVIIIHLESFQQFLINLKINGKPVTPFLNSLYQNKHTLSFANFYHQVGLGRTSDAENMLETGTYGISDGSLFTSLGSENTFQAAPQILRNDGYISAVFHGNVGSFWNRNDVYKNMGYNYFFDKNYYSSEAKDASGYGLKDKLLFAESIKYLEQMQQPFYAKFITVTNHIPFELDKKDQDPNFKTANTRDQTINNYLETAHYLDESIREFFNYLKSSGLYKNSMIIIYGDHYGLSNSENETLAPIIGESSDTWNTYNNVQMQRVPFMIHANNLKGKISHEVAGEIDVLPTLMHLLGISNKDYVQFGSDMLSPHRQNWIVFRNGTIVSQKYIIVGAKGIKGTVYNHINGKQIINFTPQEKREITELAKKAKESLHYSDLLNNHNLLRLYTPAGFVPTDPTQFNYALNYQKMIALRDGLANKSTSLYSKHHGTTTKLYHTDAPELKNRQQEITQIPENIKDNKNKEDKNNSKENTQN
ncbi:LTA synthase family protein [Lactobacillus kefiranofaciens subsp. kefirgranum]|uniref:LTA synthase family protein n=1 Tax=Lactobacillus kefiranofaciens TaxID=267818 RepID=UPI000704C58C|nr:LTA synthase family protein [Lactobacillus kefiranofaciens]MCJ2171740.1 LTA synthase family protein [Lactobacillus kefiranofaciens]MCP9330702.1 LTA synthase family protein [Lactobacillus kefiranofaciens]MDF4142330.1 LTA synthase family protein [Lactobacillus kefiranofaciens]PAK98713.1 alkaline phosphatase [Lactobacillus kefiranofaciens]QNT43588.1 LTA synthase family protein [Lactobacillus kefiranofaciens]